MKVKGAEEKGTVKEKAVEAKATVGEEKCGGSSEYKYSSKSEALSEEDGVKLVLEDGLEEKKPEEETKTLEEKKPREEMKTQTQTLEEETKTLEEKKPVEERSTLKENVGGELQVAKEDNPTEGDAKVAVPSSSIDEEKAHDASVQDEKKTVQKVVQTGSAAADQKTE
ncbi:hypothetical protein SAY86_028229 [Trapa natans]|uniref:Uncharacterized protein n=1 Tax=Trapa natans TaxID=22666 RepID=A0AAN7RG75_TRANT|nr:hypothetical protein SAY86_028229 [Trapa natans]